MNKRTVAVLGALAALAPTVCRAQVASAACDRACLAAIADDYLAAIAARDPGRAPLADDVAFVENVMRLDVGAGVWAVAAGPAKPFRIDVLDAAAGAVGLLTVIERATEHGIEPAQLAVRLKVVGRRITEAEHLIAAVESAEALARLAAPRPALVAEVPAAERMPPEQLAAIAASYYDALDRSDGTLAPFATDCERQENGVITAGPDLKPTPFDSVDTSGRGPPAVARDCAGQMSSRRFAYIDSIDHRRVFAVDPVLGLAMGLSHFRQSMARGPHLMIAADGSRTMWDEKREPYDLPAAHIFKISGGRIHEVEAVGIFVPYDSPTGWE
jgi:hypothetical protein